MVARSTETMTDHANGVIESGVLPRPSAESEGVVDHRSVTWLWSRS